jgi:putative flippase GtrA
MTVTTPTLTSAVEAEPPVLDLVIPVYNEQDALEGSVLRLYARLRADLPYSFRITIADNASTDATPVIARRLADTIPCVQAVLLPAKGRGGALASVWSTSDASVLAYMDVDLSTDLAAVLPLVAPLVSGHSDLAIGTRLSRSSRVVRGPKRELISRGYNLLLRSVLGARFSDAQCGFKAIRADRARELLPLVRDTSWFFDTELLVLAERACLRIHEVPVDWVDDPDSRVAIGPTVVADCRGILRVSRDLAAGRIALSQVRSTRPAMAQASLAGQVLRFAGVGLASTLAYLLLYLLFRALWPAQWANAVALLLTAIANTTANRRVTFGVTGRHHVLRQQVQGLVVFLIGLGLTGGALAALDAAAPGAPRPAELSVLIVANVAATLVRFLLLRRWVFPTRHQTAEETV